MGALLKFIPVIMAAIKRGKLLSAKVAEKAGVNSTTTRAQYGILIAACAIAGIGYFVPILGDNDVAVGLIVLVSPLISRILLYKDKSEAEAELPPDSATIWLYKVDTLTKEDKVSWAPFYDTLSAAKILGYSLGVDQNGVVYDVQTGEPTGDTVRLNEPESPEEIAANRAKCEEWVKSARARMTERASTDNHEV